MHKKKGDGIFPLLKEHFPHESPVILYQVICSWFFFSGLLAVAASPLLQITSQQSPVKEKRWLEWDTAGWSCWECVAQLLTLQGGFFPCYRPIHFGTLIFFCQMIHANKKAKQKKTLLTSNPWAYNDSGRSKPKSLLLNYWEVLNCRFLPLAVWGNFDIFHVQKSAFLHRKRTPKQKALTLESCNCIFLCRTHFE